MAATSSSSGFNQHLATRPSTRASPLEARRSGASAGVLSTASISGCGRDLARRRLRGREDEVLISVRLGQVVWEQLVGQYLRMVTVREPGWHLEPGSDRIERYWRAEGPTNEVRVRPGHRSPAHALGRDELERKDSDLVGMEFDTGPHPYRRGGLRWWIQAEPFIGRFYAPFFHRKRVEAEQRGELERASIGWRIAGLASTAVLVALLLLWDKVFGAAAP